MDPFGIESYIQRRMNDFFQPFEEVYTTAPANASSNTAVTQPSGGGSVETLRGGRRLRSAIAIAKMDVKETPKSISVRIDLPGIKREDIQVHLEDNVLSVQAERKEEKSEDNDRYHYSERSFGKVVRQVWLPAPVNEDKVQTRFENGVLSLDFPKNIDESRRRQITI